MAIWSYGRSSGFVSGAYYSPSVGHIAWARSSLYLGTKFSGDKVHFLGGEPGGPVLRLKFLESVGSHMGFARSHVKPQPYCRPIYAFREDVSATFRAPRKIFPFSDEMLTYYSLLLLGFDVRKL